MVTNVDTPQHRFGPGPLGRRELFLLAGSIGLAATGCSPSADSAGPPAAATNRSTFPSPALLSSATPSAVMLCRDAWGARPALAGGRPHTIDRMTIHHSAVALPDNRQIIARLQQHQRYHQDDKGWVDIAYHAAVDRRGNIFALRDTAIAGDTATNYDPAGHFLVLCEGNFDDETVSEAQLDSAALVCAWAMREFGITVGTLASHREVTPVTSCPGDGLEAHLTSGDLQQRITDIATSGFDLQPLCGPDADARVAAIQA